MTDFAQLAALRCQNTASDLRAVGFQVLSVRPATFGWRVNVSTLPAAQSTITARLVKAGYGLRRYGVDDDGLFIIVEK